MSMFSFRPCMQLVLTLTLWPHRTWIPSQWLMRRRGCCGWWGLCWLSSSSSALSSPFFCSRGKDKMKESGRSYNCFIKHWVDERTWKEIKKRQDGRVLLNVTDILQGLTCSHSSFGLLLICILSSKYFWACIVNSAYIFCYLYMFLALCQAAVFTWLLTVQGHKGEIMYGSYNLQKYKVVIWTIALNVWIQPQAELSQLPHEVNIN